ncbi:fumarate hydratase [Desulfocicer niacini]
MKITKEAIQQSANECLVTAGTTYRRDQFKAYERALKNERLDNSRWVLEQIYENGKVAEKERLPLCDDTGIPHAVIHVGEECELPAGWLSAVQAGVMDGLREMPGRPMAVKGNDIERVEQSVGLYTDPAMLELAPVITRSVPGNQLKITILLLGGGPEIRAKTRRIFHRRSIHNVLGEAVSWLKEEVSSLGCTPSVIAMGIGRSQVEASSLMLEAMAEGNLDCQNELEKKITDDINLTGVGPLGLGGDTTVLGCFLKIGPTRASGVRIVSVRPCCLVEPRRATALLG